MSDRRNPPTGRPTHRGESPNEFLRRLIALGSAALVLALTVLAASPDLHDWMHRKAGSSGGDACAVVLFAGGVSLPLDAITATPPSIAWHPPAATIATEVYFVSPRYRLQPERGPPLAG